MKRAQDVMYDTPLTVGSQLTVRALAQTLLDHGADGALVIDDTALVGVVTATDIAMRELNFAFTGHHVSDIAKQEQKQEAELVADLMTPNPVVVSPDTPMHEVARLMTQSRYSILPVLSDGVLVGVVTRRSVIAAAAAGGKPVRGQFVKEG